MTEVQIGACLWLAWLVAARGHASEDYCQRAWEAWRNDNQRLRVDAQALGRSMYASL